MTYGCDICNAEIETEQGYSFTTWDIVRSVHYWRWFFDKAAASDKTNQGDVDGSLVGWHVARLCAHSSSWIVCSECVGLVHADRTVARRYAVNRQDPPGCGPISPSEAAMAAAFGWSLVHNEWPVSIPVDQNPITHDPGAGNRCDFCRRIMVDPNEQVAVVMEPTLKTLTAEGAEFLRMPSAWNILSDGTPFLRCCIFCLKHARHQAEPVNPLLPKTEKKWWQFWK